MSLSDKQFLFAKDINLLLFYALSRGWKFSIGEVHRTKYQQVKYLEEGKTTTMESLHLHKLAADIFFFEPSSGGHELTMVKEKLQDLGDFWESLSEYNEWGGNWKSFTDTPHFQRNKTHKRAT